MIPNDNLSHDLSLKMDSFGCHLTIHKASYKHFGSWKCLITMEHVSTFQVAILNVNSSKENFRIPANLIPNEYRITIIPHIVPDKSTFDGIVAINMSVVKSTHKIYLHSKELTILEDSVEVYKNGFNIQIIGFG